MLEKVSKSLFFKEFLEILKTEGSILLEKLWDSPKALVALKAQKELGCSVLIITGGERQEKLLDDLSFFSSQDCLEFPSWEILPSEEISPNLDVVGRRFEILDKIKKK